MISYSSIIVFFISLASSAGLLLLERFVGIGWDFHPDSVTYATTSHEMVFMILENDPTQIVNNGYYFVSSLLGQSVVLITAMNMLLFSVTNAVLYKFHTSLDFEKKHLAYVALLLFNPYRLHLSTTMLKDTVIIFFVILSAYSFKSYLKYLPVLFFFRVATLIYGLVHLKRRYYPVFLLCCAVMLFVFSGLIFDFLLKFNDNDMVLRGFDKIPTFQNFGAFGIALRAFVWPLLAVTGVFFILSPALEYFPVAIGSIFTQLYCFLMSGRFQLPLGLLLALMVFGALVTGFTAYIRYVYPLLTIIPMIAFRHRLIHVA